MRKIPLGLSKTATNAQIKTALEKYKSSPHGDFDNDILNFKPTIKKNTLCVVLDNNYVVVGYYYENTL
jgi:hypothetical protein|tara:strand:+ start:901 stop:1104 length:204 start_codon:yes stop_codon:yes gene_type:complete